MADSYYEPPDGVVSVIIPCYNHGSYLSESIDSVLSQANIVTEIVIVDDGSTDNTKTVAKAYADIVYVYQQNMGLSAARNTGIALSTGKYLVFLDADDWLFPGALATNLRYLSRNSKAAFVSGAHQKINEHGEVLEEVKTPIDDSHYLHLLEGNYIGMHAAVMYNRFIFDTFRFDVTLKACEDYDIYLNIARQHSVIHHQELIAAYRIHGTNMSGNIPLMLENVLFVLRRQQVYPINETEKRSLHKGLLVWKDYYTEKLYEKLVAESPINYDRSKEELAILWHYHKFRYIKFLTSKPFMALKKTARKNIPEFIFRFLHKLGLYTKFIPAPGKIDMGDFNRTTPYSTQFGYDRGGPVDRYYIENFLQKHAGLIHGRVLEIGDNEYTMKYGASKVSKSDILHIEEGNAKATFVGDLSNAPMLPDNSFDCIVLTQTLHLIYDYKDALHTCYRVLKPGGALLMTVPGISHIDQGEWKKIWLWSFTESSITMLMQETFPAAKTIVEPFGNVLVASAFLYGVGLPELEKEQMDYKDEHYQVIITVSAVKS